MQIRLQNVRISFPNLGRPQAYGDGEPAYQAKFIIDPKSEQAKLLKDTIKAVAVEQWKDTADSVLKRLVSDKKVAYVEDEYASAKTGEVYDGFQGKHYLSARNAKTRPTILDRFGNPVHDASEIERLIYSGSFVHAMIDIWAQDNKWGRRVNCTLQGVMFAGEGDSFGGGKVASTDDFADLAQAADDLI